MTLPGGMDFGNLGNMLQQAQQHAEQLKVRMNEELRQKTVEGSAGGGMVKVTATGAMEIKQVQIDPQVVDPADREMLEDLVVAALNVALKKAKELQEEAQKGQLGNMMGGMGGGPGGMDLSSLLGGLGK